MIDEGRGVAFVLVVADAPEEAIDETSLSVRVVNELNPEDHSVDLEPEISEVGIGPSAVV